MSLSNISYTEKIRKADKFYNELTKLKVFKKGDYRDKIKALETIAYFNWHVHSGRYDSSFINSEIELLSNELVGPEEYSLTENTSSSECVFIATALLDTGGHTRLIENIAKYEHQKNRNCVLIVTDQTEKSLPLRILKQKNYLFKEIICLDEKNSREKVVEIRRLVANAFRIYNSQNPDDIEPSIALNYANRPTTYYINHADHVFWVGSKFCDCILNIRPFAKNLSQHRRNNMIESIILPIKLDLSKKQYTKNEARRELKIKKDKIVLLTISIFYKIIPDDEYNFLQTIKNILALNEKIEYYFIGITPHDFITILHEEPPDRLHLLGIIEEPILYQCAADFYLEGMPINSLTALFESIYAGAFPVLMWGPKFVNMNMENEFYLDGLIKHPENELAYMDRLQKLVEFHDEAMIDQVVCSMKRKIEYYNSNKHWDEQLSDTKVKQSMSELDYIEFDCDITDIHLYKAWETYWKFQQTNVYEVVMKKIVTHLSLFRIHQFYYNYIFKDPLVSNIAKLKIYRRVIKNKLGMNNKIA